MRRPPAVAHVLERMVATCRRHEMFNPGTTALVCVSGGPDSVCLVESLVRLRRLFRIRLEVFHLDHGLRQDSADDARYVGRLAARLKLPFHLRRTQESPAAGRSVEEWARLQRMVHAADVAREVGAERIAEGHTLDDQAETLLIAIVRGGGLDALAGIRPVAGPEVQPLLDTTRQEVEAFCRSLRLSPRLDPTNLDTRFLRNAIRLRGLPALERATGRELRGTLARTTDLLRIDQSDLNRRAMEAAEQLIDEGPEEITLPAAELLSHSRAVSSRVVRAALILAGIPYTQDAVEAVLDLAAGRTGRRRDLPAGLKARRDRQYVHLSRPSPG